MSDGESYIDRRSFVATVGASGITAVAGCSGGDSSGNGNSEDLPEGVLNKTLHMAGGIDFSVINWNLFNPQGDTTPQRTMWWVYDTLGRFHQTEQEWYPIIAEDFTLDDGTITISLRDDYVWHDGDQLTAEDVVTQYRIERYLDHQLWDFATSIEAEDDYTVVIEADEVNPDIVWPVFLDNQIFAKADEYGEFLEDLESSDGSDDAVNAVLEHQVDEPIGNGPFEVVDAGNDTITMERFADYARAENINWHRVEAEYFPSEDTLNQAAIGDDIDGIDFMQMPDNILQQLPDHWETIRVPGFEGPMIAFSPESDVLGTDAENGLVLRRAIAHLLDFEEFTSLVNSETVPEIQCGLSEAVVDEYLGDVGDEFTRYGTTAQIDEAEQLLEDAGFQQDGEQWIRPNGEPLELPVKYPGGWTGDSPAFQNVADQLDRFGISSEEVPVENTNFFGPTIEEHDYEVAIAGTWGQAGFSHPYFNLRANLGTLTEPAYQYTPEVEEYDVPMPVGDAGGSTETINVNEKLQALGSVTDEEEERQLVRELAWTVNQNVPYLQPTEGFNQHFITHDEWDYPDDSEKVRMNVPYIELPKLGEMQASE